MASFEHAPEMAHPGGESGGASGGASVGRNGSVVPKAILPFPRLDGFVTKMTMDSGVVTVEIGSGPNPFRFKTNKTTLFIVDMETPFYVTIDFIKKLSTEIQNGLIKFVFNVIVDKECGELDSRIDDQMCAFLYLLYDTLKTKTRGLSSLSKLEYFDEFKKYTKSKAMKEMVSKFKKTHFVPQYVTMLHYLQEDVKTDWVIELVFKSSDKTVVSSRKELRDFFADNSKNLFKVNDPQMIKILKILADCFHVKRGFTGDNRETPIPTAVTKFERYNGSMDSSVYGIAGILGKTIFRHIGVEIDEVNLGCLLTLLCYSDVVTLNPNVKEALEGLLSLPELFYDRPMLPTSILMWKSIRNFPEHKGSDGIKSHAEACALVYYFVQWYNNSSIKDDFSVMEVSQIFNLCANTDVGQINFTNFFTSDYHKKQQVGFIFNPNVIKAFAKSPLTRYFHEWVEIFQWASDWTQTNDLKIGSLMVNEELLQRIVNGLGRDIDPGNHEIKADVQVIHQYMEQFKTFLIKKGFNFETCILCDESRPLKIKGVWKKIDCNSGCNINLCSGCYNQNYNSTPDPGHMLQLSKISCIQCRSILINTEIYFPVGTATEDIVEFSNQFYSCCAVGCQNFIHVPPAEGATCADRPEHIVDTFCTVHSLSLGREVQTMMKPCPGCNHMIFKVEGCNHMKCTNCATEFCMRPECKYFSHPGERYSHLSYCRAGISDEITIEGLFQVVSRVHETANALDQSEETKLFVSTVLTNIVFPGLDYSIYGRLFELLEYINTVSVAGHNLITLHQVLNSLITAINTIYPNNVYLEFLTVIQQTLTH